MGAIAAFSAPAAPPSMGVVEAMSAAVAHRGRRGTTLMHGRCALSCTNRDDLPDAGLAIEHGVAVAFVGTLDNAHDIARALEKRRLAPPTTPAGLIAAGFRAYGQDLPRRLRGVFAAIVTDGQTVHCFRDHLGYGTLFYRHDGSGFYAASEAKQVVAGAGLRREPDLDVVERIFFHKTDDEMPCALRGVRRLPKTTVLTVGQEGVRQRRYWDPSAVLETARLSQEEMRARFEELMDQAVARCLTGQDVISLSGGVDSPAVAGFAAPRHLELSGRPLHAQTAVFPRYPTVDERRYVEPLAEHYKLPLHTFEQRANGLADLTKWVTLADGPYGAPALAQYAEDYLLARERGFQTILTGEHAEFVYGLNWYLVDHLLTHGRFRAAQRHLQIRRRKGQSLISLGRLVGGALAPAAYHAARSRRDRTSLPEWIDVRMARVGAAEDLVSARRRWRQLQISAFVGPGIAAEAESTCQAVCGVRSRRPWTDVDLFEFFLSLPAEQKFPDTAPKSLVRELLKGRVPDFILDRRDKTVFDEAMLSEIDYATLQRLLVASDYRMPGVDYEVLAERLRRQELGMVGYNWARQLAGVHAFVSCDG